MDKKLISKITNVSKQAAAKLKLSLDCFTTLIFELENL